MRRIADQLAPLAYHRIYGKSPGQLIEDGPAAVERSGAGHIAWCRGEHDEMT